MCRQVASFSATPMAAEQALAGAIPLADSQAAAELLLQVGLLGIAALHKTWLVLHWVVADFLAAAEGLLQVQSLAGHSCTKALHPCCLEL